MRLYVHTDPHTDGRDEAVHQIEAKVTAALSRFSDDITRVDVFLTDETAGTARRVTKRCLLEVRPDGVNPIVVVHEARSATQALGGALHKISGTLQSHVGRLDDRKGAASIRTGHD